jgi:hypothetical protein
VSEPPRRRYELSDEAMNRELEALVARAEELAGPSESAESVRQLLVTALRLVSDRTSRAELKLLSNAMKELRHAFRVFAPYEHVRKVAVFGSARTAAEEPAFAQARRFAARIVEEGWMVITGAGAGIMGAAQEGAGRAASFGMNIRLPFEQKPNPTIAGDPKLINCRYFFTRKLVFVKEAHAIALFPGGFGTHDEGFEALTLIQTGRSEIVPVVFVDEPGGSYWRDWEQYVRSHLRARGLIDDADTALFRITDDAEQAVREITGFYRNYHSSRFVGEWLVLRVHVAPEGAELEAIQREFADLVLEGAIEVRGPLPEEGGEMPALPRLVLRFDRRRVGRLRLLIDRLNAAVAGAASPLEAVPRAIVEGRLAPEDERAELEPGGAS